MTTPGTQIVTRAAPPSRSGPSATGTWHVAALAERGPTDSPRMLLNLGDYDKNFGKNRLFTQRDAIEAHFRNGGNRVNFQRFVGPAATLATVALPGASLALSLSVDGVGAGPVPFLVEVTVDGSTFRLVIYESGVAVQTSPPLASTADAAAWALTSPYVRVRATGSATPIVTTAGGVAIAGGADDRVSVTDVHRVSAVNRIPKGDGPGQVSIPGATTTDAHVGLAAHALVNNRFPVMDLPNTAVEADLISVADAFRAAATDDEEGYSFLVEGWHTIPGVTVGTTRTVPPSAIVSALMAKHDALTGNPNEPAAGVNGIPSFSLGIARANWSDAARGRLNAAGVNVFRFVGGENRLYGYRTGANVDGPSAPWLNAANSRLRMAIQADADTLAEPFVFSQITKSKIAEYNGVLSGLLLGYYSLGALFGGSPAEAFIVDTGSAVNTADRIAARYLSAVMGLRMSEFAEVVYMEFVKVPVTEVL